MPFVIIVHIHSAKTLTAILVPIKLQQFYINKNIIIIIIDLN